MPAVIKIYMCKYLPQSASLWRTNLCACNGYPSPLPFTHNILRGIRGHVPLQAGPRSSATAHGNSLQKMSLCPERNPHFVTTLPRGMAKGPGKPPSPRVEGGAARRAGCSRGFAHT